MRVVHRDQALAEVLAHVGHQRRPVLERQPGVVPGRLRHEALGELVPLLEVEGAQVAVLELLDGFDVGNVVGSHTCFYQWTRRSHSAGPRSRAPCAPGISPYATSAQPMSSSTSRWCQKLISGLPAPARSMMLLDLRSGLEELLEGLLVGPLVDHQHLLVGAVEVVLGGAERLRPVHDALQHFGRSVLDRLGVAETRMVMSTLIAPPRDRARTFHARPLPTPRAGGSPRTGRAGADRRLLVIGDQS